MIDIEAFALANAYQMNYPERTDPFAALIHVGRSVTIVCLLERGEPVFTRDISIGGQVHLDGLVRELGPQGVDDLTGKRILHGQVPHDVNHDTVSTVLRDASTQLVMEIRKTIDFYRATAPIDRLSRIVLSGGAWQAAGLVDMLASEFGAPVDVFDPFRRVTKPSRGIGATPSVRVTPWPSARDAAGGRPMIVSISSRQRPAPCRRGIGSTRAAVSVRRSRAPMGRRPVSAAGGGICATSAAVNVKIEAANVELTRLKNVATLVEKRRRARPSSPSGSR